LIGEEFSKRKKFQKMKKFIIDKSKLLIKRNIVHFTKKDITDFKEIGYIKSSNFFNQEEKNNMVKWINEIEKWPEDLEKW
jgi:hypothetical protein